MMKILVVCQYYYPENFQITPICEELARDGYDITVLTGLPNYPTGIIPEDYQKGKRRDEMINGVHVIRCHEISRSKGIIGLAKNYLSFLWSATWKINTLKLDFDVVFVYQLSPILMGIPACIYAKRHKKPLFLYCCDLWPESLKIYIKSENNPIYKVIKRISRYVYRACDRIACQSETFLPYLQSTHRMAASELCYLPAFADETYLTEDFTSEDDCIDFVFMGNIGKAQNLLEVLQAVKKISCLDNFKVHFVGDGSAVEELKSYVCENNLMAQVIFHGRHPVEEMPRFYKLADACLVSLKADSEIGKTLPSKVQGYMAAGKPIIGMIEGATQKVVAEANCGVCVPAGDVGGLANVMQDFIQHKEKYSQCGENARKYFKEHFRKQVFMDRLESELEGLVKNEYLQR